jgi:GNAT superfamily N-acetyltransferase
MMFMIRHTKVTDLSVAEEIRCRELSFGDEGYMCDNLDFIFDTESDVRKYRYSYAYLYEENNEILGWALLMPVWRSKFYEVHVFVDPAYRRRGIGSKLLQSASHLTKQMIPTIDKDNNEFFLKNKELVRL